MKDLPVNEDASRGRDLTPWFDQFRDAEGNIDYVKARKALIMRNFDVLHAVNTDTGWPPNSRIIAVREMSELSGDISGDMPQVDAALRAWELRAALELDQTTVLTGIVLEAPYDPKTGFTMWSWGWLSLVAVPNGMRLQQVRSKLAAYDRANDRDLGQTYSISEADSPRQLFQHLSEIVDMETFFYKDLDALDEAAEIAIIPERAIAQANALIELIPEGKQACFHIPIGQVDNYQDEEKAGTEH